MNDIKSLISDYTKILPISEVRILLQNTASLALEELLLKQNYILSIEEISKFREYCARREKGEPIAYIIGKKEFFGLEFKVNKHVLIPRPETEIIVEAALQLKSKKILDLCCGSGAIGITLGKYSHSSISFADISEAALNITKFNAQTHNILNTKFILSNWFSEITEKYDLIVCNPPYIPLSEKNIMAKETLEYEPHLALFAEENGYSSYQILAKKSYNFLNKDGKLIIECGYNQADQISKIFRSYNWKEIARNQDLSNIDRSLTFTHEE